MGKAASMETRGWRDAFFHKISVFETRSRFLFTESQASRRDRDFLSFDLEIRDEIEIFQ